MLLLVLLSLDFRGECRKGWKSSTEWVCHPREPRHTCGSVRLACGWLTSSLPVSVCGAYGAEPTLQLQAWTCTCYPTRIPESSTESPEKVCSSYQSGEPLGREALFTWAFFGYQVTKGNLRSKAAPSTVELTAAQSWKLGLSSWSLPCLKIQPWFNLHEPMESLLCIWHRLWTQDADFTRQKCHGNLLKIAHPWVVERSWGI